MQITAQTRGGKGERRWVPPMQVPTLWLAVLGWRSSGQGPPLIPWGRPTSWHLHAMQPIFQGSWQIFGITFKFGGLERSHLETVAGITPVPPRYDLWDGGLTSDTGITGEITRWILLIPPYHQINTCHLILVTGEYLSSHPCHQMNTSHPILVTLWLLLIPSLPPDEYCTSHPILAIRWILPISSLSPYDYFSSHPWHQMDTSHSILATRWILLIASLPPDEYFSSHPYHQMNTSHPILATRRWILLIPTCRQINTCHRILAKDEYSQSILTTRWILYFSSLSPNNNYFSSHPSHQINTSHPILATRWILSSHPCHQMKTSHPILATRWILLITSLPSDE